MRRSGRTSGKRGTSLAPDKGKGVRSDVGFKRCPASTLDQRVRWTRGEEYVKEAKLIRVRYPYRTASACQCPSGSSLPTLTRKKPGYTGGVPFITCLFHSCPGSLNTFFFPNPRRWRGEKETHTGAISCSCFFLPFSSLESFTCTAAESTKNKNSVQYFLSVEQMVENDNPKGRQRRLKLWLMRKAPTCLRY
jgi:hypothetical protein